MKKFYQVHTKSLTDYNVGSQKDLWEKVKSEGYTGLVETVVTEYKKAVESPYYHAVFSSASQDRHGDIVKQNFVLDSFVKNPVYLDSHNYDSIEHIIGKIHNINTLSGNLEGDIEFAVMNPKGLLAQQLADNGFASASSIGFIPLEFDANGFIVKSELLEISMVSVPANPDALLEKKIEVKSEEPEEIKVEVKKVNRKTATDIVAKIAKDKQKTFDMLVKLSHELVLDGKKAKSRKIHQIVRALSK